jgi:hypothetical protein
MFRKIILSLLLLLVVLLPASMPVYAQTYSFSLDQLRVDLYLETDGSARLEYIFVFTNDSWADPLDFVDVGMPTKSYNLSNISASVNGNPINHIAYSEYVDGIELGLGADSIQPGQTGTVRMTASGIQNMLFTADQEGYASVMFAPTWFDQEFVSGMTDVTVSFHLPPGIQPDEPFYFEPPKGWPQQEPITGFDADGRVLYVWRNQSGNAYTPYVFGAAFPAAVVPNANIQTPTVTQRLGIDTEALAGFCCFGGFVLLFIGIIAASVRADKKRRMKYLPPKVAIEGHGIKRGLTAVESAILLEKPLNTVLTMILFSIVKKGAARVVTENPLKVEKTESIPEDLRTYEKEFLEAIIVDNKRSRDKALQVMFTRMITSVQKKMKGFSLKETKTYYRSIVDKAWEMVETAETPEVRSERYSDNLEWTMLDKDFEDRTERTFRTGPVYVPMWWGSFRPSYGGGSGSVRAGSGTPGSVTASTGMGGRVNLPTLPGSAFAASVVGGVQNTAGGIVSNLTDFTSGITKTTNPVPKSSSGSYRSGSSGGCACACACAGCACACAGGGR